MSSPIHSSQFDMVCRQIGFKVSRDVTEACRFLEAHGQQFCVDFGVENAIQKARIIMLLDDLKSEEAMDLYLMDTPDGVGWVN